MLSPVVCGKLGTLDMQGVPTLFPGPREEQSLERVPEPAERARLVKILWWASTYHFSALTCFREHFAKQEQKKMRRDLGNVSLKSEAALGQSEEPQRDL